MGILEDAWDATFRGEDEKLLIAALSVMGLRLATRQAVLDYPAEIFGNAVYGRIWAAAAQLAGESKLFTPANMRPLVGEAENRIYEALQGVPVREIEFTEGLRLVQESAQKRKLITLLKQAAARTGTDDYGVSLAYTHELLAAVEHGEVDTGGVTLTDTLTDFWESVDSGVTVREKLATPWRTLNDRFLRGGHARGQLVTWMAPSGGGKSVALLQEAGCFIRRGLSVAVFSLEMDREDVTNRLLASATGVPIGHIEDRRITTLDERELLEAATDDLRRGQTHIFDANDMTVPQMRQHCAILKRTTGLDVVVVDYLQIVTPESTGGNREQEVAAITRQLKALAMSLDVLVLTASQMNESSSSGPTKESARESRAIIHNSDLVLGLHHKGQAGEVDMVVVKNRRGPESPGVLMFWEPEKALITDPTG